MLNIDKKLRTVSLNSKFTGSDAVYLRYYKNKIQ